MQFLQDLMPSLRLSRLAPSTIRKHLFKEETETVDTLCQMMMDSDGEYSSLLLAERILNAYNNATHMVDGNQVEVSISIGLATLELTGGLTGDDLINAADEALKHAKQRGKACVVSYADL